MPKSKRHCDFGRPGPHCSGGSRARRKSSVHLRPRASFVGGGGGGGGGVVGTREKRSRTRPLRMRVEKGKQKSAKQKSTSKKKQKPRHRRKPTKIQRKQSWWTVQPMRTPVVCLCNLHPLLFHTNSQVRKKARILGRKFDQLLAMCQQKAFTHVEWFSQYHSCLPLC